MEHALGHALLLNLRRREMEEEQRLKAQFALYGEYAVLPVKRRWRTRLDESRGKLTAAFARPTARQEPATT
ncbi:MAG: hypothetical protein R2839_12245 [Thermomicrobiales bacterium]